MLDSAFDWFPWPIFSKLQQSEQLRFLLLRTSILLPPVSRFLLQWRLSPCRLRDGDRDRGEFHGIWIHIGWESALFKFWKYFRIMALISNSCCFSFCSNHGAVFHILIRIGFTASFFFRSALLLWFLWWRALILISTMTVHLSLEASKVSFSYIFFIVLRFSFVCLFFFFLMVDSFKFCEAMEKNMRRSVHRSFASCRKLEIYPCWRCFSGSISIILYDWLIPLSALISDLLFC